MAEDRFRDFAEGLLNAAGVRTDGRNPWDMQVHDARLFARTLSHGSLGLGEAYMDGWWDCPRLDQFFERVLGANLESRIKGRTLLWHGLRARLFNLQRPRRAFEIGHHHYDIGNDLYERMLDRRMTYSCGYWAEAETLEEAQEAKLDLICRKLRLAPGQRVLDIGCGWGGAAAFAAERYGVEVVGVTVSEQQVEYARHAYRDLPVEVRLQDYRELRETFDAIFSIGMFEHVGYKNYGTFFDVVRRCLKPDGLMVLHTIGGNRSTRRTDPWIATYIFPNSMLPSAAQITAAAEGRFVLEDWHSFGADYDRTLMAWHRNFENAWPELSDRYGERFHRMWRYYLLSCAGSFRARKNQLWQIVLSPKGVPGGYRSPR
jgi:cyclopropane-fatty-acyl-phospholipid synthase